MLAAVQWLAMGAITIMSGCALRKPATAGTTTFVAGAGAGKPVSHFPNKQELRARFKAAASTSTTISVDMPSVSVERWSILEPIADADAPCSGRSRWDRLLVEVLAGTPIVPSEALRCAAQESARFYVENGGYPDEALRQFLVERCGSSLASTDVGILYGSLSGAVTEQKLADEYSPKLRDLIEQAIRVKPTEIGLGYAQGKGRVAFCLLVGRAVGRIESHSLDPSGERVDLSGTMPSDTAYIWGLITHGAYGVRSCESDRTIAVPRFKLSCPVAREDERATIEIAGRRSSEMLWSVILRRSVQPQPSAGHEYKNPIPTAVAVSSEPFAQRLHGAINATRKRMSHAELELIREQSTSNQELSRYIYEAKCTKNQSQLELAALGLLAGWDVPGTIRDGMVYWAGFENASTPENWLAAAMASPFGRFSLLDATKTRIAIGAHHYGRGATMAVVSTYALYESENHDVDESTVFKEILALRRARGKSDPVRVARSPLLTAALTKVVRHERSAEDAAADLFDQASQGAGRPVQVWMVETNSLFQFTPPDSLFAANLNVEVGVTHYKPEGAAWGQYLIIFVLHPANTAMVIAPLGTRSRG